MVDDLAPDDLLGDVYDEGAVADSIVNADNRVPPIVLEDIALMGATPGMGGVEQEHGSLTSIGLASPAPGLSRVIDGPADDTVVAATAGEKAVSAPPAGSGDAAAPIKGNYPQPADRPTQTGAEGIFFDFNQGCRVLLPPREHGSWRARLRDLDTGNILFETENKGALIRSSKRWYVRFSIEVWSIEEGRTEPRLVLNHQYDASEREVLIQFPVGTLGDSIAWFSYAARFGARHPGCRVTCVMAPAIIALLRDAYPDIRFVAPEEVAAQKLAESAYATYCLGLFFTDAACEHQPTDFRFVGLHRTAAYILGVDLEEKPPRLALPDDSRPIAEPYAVIAVQATSGAKYWNNPNGWRDVVAFLKGRGYRVVCIDQKPVHGSGIMWTHIPHGVEDETGRPLSEAARWLKHASLFVGLSSGLSWLAWAAGCPAVLISGFSHPTTEFTTPYRVINWHTCNGCWNDPKHCFDHKDFLWCPRHANTPRQFECTRLITSAQVMRVIEAIPSFGSHSAPT
ncbi:MAG: autotransporter strand-loop-strand O-heptosyltransferase [Roseiarcus sp.]|jgi:autotransporter strand-loop-strand O-heptosyltransferase